MQNQLLSVQPNEATVAARGGETVHQVTNHSSQRMAFKVKTSNTDDYRVHPVFGFVEASSNANINVTRRDGQPRHDRLVVQLVPTSSDATDPQSAFAQQDVPRENMLTINLNAT